MVAGLKRGEPAIIFSRILSFGEEYDVFSVTEMPKHPEKYFDIRGSVKSVFLLPSLDADIKIEIPGFCPKRLFSLTPAAVAAARFIFCVRGLPLSEITVETPIGIITVLSGKGGKCSVYSERFSLVEQGKIILLGEEIKTVTVKSPFGKIRALNVNSAPDFSPMLLREAALSREGEELIGAVAVDKTGGAVYHFSKCGEFPKAFTAATAAKTAFYNEISSVKIGEDIFSFAQEGGRFAAFDSGKAPLTFYAPAID